jgi:hypothetical protein
MYKFLSVLISLAIIVGLMRFTRHVPYLKWLFYGEEMK